MRIALVALLAIGALGLGGCSVLPGCADPRDPNRGIPGTTLADLPDNPDPSKQYCKCWVPAKVRKVPKLVKMTEGHIAREKITVMETTASEVLVRPRTGKYIEDCGQDCTETLVQVKPGGYRWERVGNCWQYKYRAPQYQSCKKKVRENSIKYCVETPPEYKTVAKTRPVSKTREKYVPPKYEVQWVEEVYEPGHYEWRSSERCTPTQDKRSWTPKQLMDRSCKPRPRRQSKALDRDCPTTN